MFVFMMSFGKTGYQNKTSNTRIITSGGLLNFEDGGSSTDLWNAGILPQHCTASQPWRTWLGLSWQWKPQISHAYIEDLEIIAKLNETSLMTKRDQSQIRTVEVEFLTSG